jgi:hypothetical protein
MKKWFAACFALLGFTGCGGGFTDAPLAFPSFEKESWGVIHPAEGNIQSLYVQADTDIEIGVLRPSVVDQEAPMQHAGVPVVLRLIQSGCLATESLDAVELKSMPPVYGTRLRCDDGAYSSLVISLRRFEDSKTLVAVGRWPTEGNVRGEDTLLKLAVDLSYQSVPSQN